MPEVGVGWWTLWGGGRRWELVGARGRCGLPLCWCCFPPATAAVVLRRRHSHHWPPLPQTAERTAAIGSALTHVGVVPHGRVGVYGANAPEWMIAMQVGEGVGWDGVVWGGGDRLMVQGAWPQPATAAPDPGSPLLLLFLAARCCSSCCQS